jgi:hypothetical protein
MDNVHIMFKLWYSAPPASMAQQPATSAARSLGDLVEPSHQHAMHKQHDSCESWHLTP